MSEKFCKHCEVMHPIEQFPLRSHRGSHYRESMCREGIAARSKEQRRRKEAGEVSEYTPRRYLPPRPAEEAVCDAAFLQWQGGEPRQDWRVRL